MRWIAAWPAFLLALGNISASASASRSPVPFIHPYHDGYIWTLWSQSYTDDELGAMLDRIAAAGARFLVIPAYGCQTSITSSDVGACDIDTRAFAIRQGTLARQHGFDVTFLPIIVTPNWDWRGDFDPPDVKGWFASYTKWMRDFVHEASSLGVPEMIVASEFKRLYRQTAPWKAFLKSMRLIYSGPLVVTANWDSVDYGFWGETDAIGISTYYPLSGSKTPTQAELNDAWTKLHAQVLALSKKYSLPIYMTELGYSSSAVAAVTPWLTDPSARDDTLQAMCFTAFSQVWAGDTTLMRVNVWGTGDASDPTYATGFDPLNKPAQSVLHSFFDLRAKLSGR